MQSSIMVDIVIFGGYSSICRNKVFKHLEFAHNNFRSLLAFDRVAIDSTQEYHKYLLDKCSLTDINFINKFIYIYGEFNIQTYKNKISNLLQEGTIIYVGTPALCYPDILNFLQSSKCKCKVILEKPLGNNKQDFIHISRLIDKSIHNVFLCDHYIYKCNNLISHIKKQHKIIKSIHIKLNFSHDVESRLGYFNKTGLFVDLFQGHILWILFELIGEFSDLDLSQIKIEKKQYYNFGGDLEIDTFFKLQFNVNNTYLTISCGKKMHEDLKIIRVNNIDYNITDCSEYYLLFKDVLVNNSNDLVNNYINQEAYWNITEFISVVEKIRRGNKCLEKYNIPIRQQNLIDQD